MSKEKSILNWEDKRQIISASGEAREKHEGFG